MADEPNDLSPVGFKIDKRGYFWLSAQNVIIIGMGLVAMVGGWAAMKASVVEVNTHVDQVSNDSKVRDDALQTDINNKTNMLTNNLNLLTSAVTEQSKTVSADHDMVMKHQGAIEALGNKINAASSGR